MAVSSALAETSGSVRTSHTKELSFRGPQSFVTIHAAFNSNFVEGDSQEMTLEDVDNEIFAMVVVYLYTGNFLQGNNPKVPVVDLGKLWNLADRLMIPHLQNRIILDKLGAPLHLYAKNGRKDLVLAMKELVEYVDLSESSEKWLGQYCIRSLVTLCQPEQIATTRSKETRDNIKTIMGNSVAGGIVLALLKFGPAIFREWNAKDFLVDENF